MRHSLGCVVVCACALATGHTVFAQGAETLTLDDAIARALKESRPLQAADLDVKKFEAQQAAVRTRRYPMLNVSALGARKLSSLDFTFTQGSLGTVPGVGPFPATDTTISTPLDFSGLLTASIAQPLTPLYAVHLSLGQARLATDLAQAQGRAARQDVVHQVKRLYFGILHTERARHAAEESVELYRELHRITTNYVAEQSALKSQQLEAAAGVAKAQHDLASLRSLLTSQKEQLNHALGRDIRTEFTVAPVPESDLFAADLDSARALALSRRPEIQVARLQARQAEQDRRIKKAEYIPDVSVAFQYLGFQNFSTLIPPNITTLGVQVRMEPFDWGRKKQELVQKDAAGRQATLNAQEVESKVLLDVGARYRAFQDARLALDVARATQQVAIETLRVLTERLTEQSALLKDVLQARVSLADANATYQQALSGFWTARADFDKAVGEDP